MLQVRWESPGLPLRKAVNRLKKQKANRSAAVAIIVQSNDKNDYSKVFQESQPKSKQHISQ